MRAKIVLGIGLMLAASSVQAQEVVWKAANSAPSAPSLTLGQPQPIAPGGFVPIPTPQDNAEVPRVARGQAPPPPPAFPGAAPAGPYPPGNAYDTGVVNNDADLGGFWSSVGNKLKHCFSDAGNAFQPGPGGTLFQSNTVSPVFSSPVTNPFFFEDPRSLTEVRPVFMWQHTPSANPAWNGGNNYVFAVTGSVAITQDISFTLNRLGFESINPEGNVAGVSRDTGFTEVLLGPKFTFLHSETSGTVAAVGLIFDIPGGSSRIYQDTGHLMLDPYFSIVQNFGRSDYGSFNFMNTTGYTFRTDNTRSESLYSSFHLDYDVGALHRFFPLVELNWRHYTRDGGAQNFNFEGSDLANFGSRNINGFNDLTLAFGGRIKITDHIQWGIAAEFNTLGNSDGRHLDEFRLTTDFIFRY